MNTSAWDRIALVLVLSAPSTGYWSALAQYDLVAACSAESQFHCQPGHLHFGRSGRHLVHSAFCCGRGWNKGHNSPYPHKKTAPSGGCFFY
jgi:hypothetical protein